MSARPNISRATTHPCESCAIELPHSVPSCPHCGDQHRHPNVLLAMGEKKYFDEIYSTCRREIVLSGTKDAADRFERACSASNAVACSTLEKLTPIVSSLHDTFANFYQTSDLLCRTDPQGWGEKRRIAETHLLATGGDSIRLHYASLSISGHGLSHYGNCTLIYRDNMIEKRATVFPYNSLEYFLEFPNQPAPGMSAVWTDRHKLCLIKYCRELNNKMTDQEFAGVLLQPKSEMVSKDKFVEVHISGDITLRTIRTIKIPRPPLASRLAATLSEKVAAMFSSQSPSKPYYKYFQNACKNSGVELILT